MPNIRMSPKHGLNPTISVCFFCGKEKNEIALLGKLKNDAEAPRNAVIDYEPCEECKAKFSLGIAFIAVSTVPQQDGQMPIQIDRKTDTRLYPTGDVVVVKEEALERLPIEQEFIDAALRVRKMLVQKETFDMLFGHIRQTDAEEGEE